MSLPQWHVFYRTIGMTERKDKGWMRSDFLADTAEEALSMLMEQRHNVHHARVYPGASAYTVTVGWRPEVEVRHTPHNNGLFAPLAEDWDSSEDDIYDVPSEEDE
jgi:hypothetical protein